MNTEKGHGIYSTELSKGQGAIAETMTLLAHWKPGISSAELAQSVLQEGILARATARRVTDLVRSVFSRRYLVEEGRPAEYLKYLAERGVDSGVTRQIMLIYTARIHTVLRDFIAEVYWGRYSAGADSISRSDAEEFIKQAMADGRISPPWSETMQLRVAQYLTGTLADFGFVNDVKKKERPLRAYRLLTETALFLAHEIHFKGFSDNSILESPDWKLFGLAREEVVQQLDKVARGGHFILQYSGDLLRVSWKYQSMEECLDAIAGQ
ncbi:MAG: DUF1819 family protein [Candidatus Thiodiazotropha sp.]